MYSSHQYSLYILYMNCLFIFVKFVKLSCSTQQLPLVWLVVAIFVFIVFQRVSINALTPKKIPLAYRHMLEHHEIYFFAYLIECDWY